MERTLITCPVCKADQHVYAKRLCIHKDGTLTCSGSKMTMPEISKYIAQHGIRIPYKYRYGA